MKIDKNSLQARVKNISLQKNVPLMLSFKSIFDAFLKRLSKTKYVDNFVFKGGFLLSASLGIDFRSTMDIDFLLRNLAFNKENIRIIFDEIISVDVDDNIAYEIKEITDIREEDQYGGYSVSLLGRLENIRVNVNIDIATGDPITPSSISYKYKCLFDDAYLDFLAYNFETILSGKTRTILSRGTTNSRSKDFYDVYIIYKLRKSEINETKLKNAFDNTCKYRNTLFSYEDTLSILNELSGNQIIKDRWENYIKKNAYARDVAFEDTIKSIKTIIESIFGK